MEGFASPNWGDTTTTGDQNSLLSNEAGAGGTMSPTGSPSTMGMMNFDNMGSSSPPLAAGGSGNPNDPMQQQMMMQNMMMMNLMKQNQELMAKQNSSPTGRHVNMISASSPTTNPLVGTPVLVGDGKPKDSFRVTKWSPCGKWVFLFLYFALLTTGLIGLGTFGSPGAYICLGLGGFFFLFTIIVGPRHISFSKNTMDRHLTVTIITIAPPFFGYKSFQAKHQIEEMEYAIHNWITTSRDKHGQTHTHHHNALAIDGIGVAQLDHGDMTELSACLGRNPTSRGGEPEESVCFCCTCGTACGF